MSVVVLVVAASLLLMFIFASQDGFPVSTALSPTSFTSNHHRHSTLSSNLRAFFGMSPGMGMQCVACISLWSDDDEGDIMKSCGGKSG